MGWGDEVVGRAEGRGAVGEWKGGVWAGEEVIKCR